MEPGGLMPHSQGITEGIKSNEEMSKSVIN